MIMLCSCVRGTHSMYVVRHYTVYCMSVVNFCMSQALLDTMLERDYCKEISYDTTDGPSLVTMVSLYPPPPARSPSINADVLELKKKARAGKEVTQISLTAMP